MLTWPGENRRICKEGNNMSIFKWDKVGLFVGGMVFATKGIEALTGKAAHKLYVHTTAAALRGRDEVMENVTLFREGCEDIYAEAVELNEQRANAPEAEVVVIEDKSVETPADAPAEEEPAKKPRRRTKKADK